MTKTKSVFKILDMRCASCAMIIESDLDDAGINAKCSYAKQCLEIEHEGKIDEKKIIKIVKNSGYNVSPS